MTNWIEQLSTCYQSLVNPRRRLPKSSTRFSPTPLLTDGQSKTIYRDGTLRGRPTRKHVRCPNTCIFQRKYMKEEHLIKPPLGKVTTLTVLTVNIREEKPSHQPKPRRAALSRTRKTMQAIRVIGQTVKKHGWCMDPGTLHQSVKYSSINLRSTAQSVQKEKKARSSGNKCVVRPSN